MDLLRDLFDSENQKKHLVHHPDATPNPDVKPIKSATSQKIYEEEHPIKNEKKKGAKAREAEQREEKKRQTKAKVTKEKEAEKEATVKRKETENKRRAKEEEDKKDIDTKKAEDKSVSVHQSAVSLGRASQRPGSSSSSTKSASVLGKHSTSSPNHPVNTGKGIKNLKQYKNKTYNG